MHKYFDIIQSHGYSLHCKGLFLLQKNLVRSFVLSHTFHNVRGEAIIFQMEIVNIIELLVVFFVNYVRSHRGVFLINRIFHFNSARKKN